MSEAVRYRLNSPNVIAETLDGEALIINLRTGCYYSIDGSGEAIWALLCAGWTAPEVAARLQPGSGTDVHAEVLRLAEQLVAEELLVRGEGIEKDAVEATVAGLFVTPTLKKYVDMQDLLLADPIHDVEAAGWPNLAAPRVGELA